MLSRFPALATRDARIFYAGQFFSLVGTWMQNTVQPYVAYRISGQPLYLGLVGFAATVPTLLFTLFGGVIIERVDKRKAVIVLQVVMMVQAFVLAALTLSGLLTIWHIIALAFVLGTANSFEITARQAMLIELVGKPALPNAIAMQSTIFNVARVLGPSLAAPFLLLLQGVGEGWAFFANGVSYLFVIAGLLVVRTTPVNTPVQPTLGTAERHTALDAFREGQNYIRNTSLVAILVGIAAVFGFFGFTPIQQLPVFAKDVLGEAGDTDATVAARNSVLAIAQGIGALVASFTLLAFSNIRRKGLLLTVGSIVFSVALMGMAWSRSLFTALSMMLVIGWGSVTTLALMNTIIQLTVPNALRGRVFSTYLWALQGVAPFGSLFVGWLTQTLGAPIAVTICGLACLMAFAAVNFSTATVRRFAM
jgi:MFS family permease